MNRAKVAERLEELRIPNGYSQAKASKALGVCESAYGMYERGERMPKDVIKERIAELFNLTVAEIFFS